MWVTALCGGRQSSERYSYKHDAASESLSVDSVFETLYHRCEVLVAEALRQNTKNPILTCVWFTCQLSCSFCASWLPVPPLPPSHHFHCCPAAQHDLFRLLCNWALVWQGDRIMYRCDQSDIAASLQEPTYVKLNYSSCLSSRASTCLCKLMRVPCRTSHRNASTWSRYCLGPLPPRGPGPGDPSCSLAGALPPWTACTWLSP